MAITTLMQILFAVSLVVHSGATPPSQPHAQSRAEMLSVIGPAATGDDDAADAGERAGGGGAGAGAGAGAVNAT